MVPFNVDTYVIKALICPIRTHKKHAVLKHIHASIIYNYIIILHYIICKIIQFYRNLRLQYAYKTVLLYIDVQRDNRVKISSNCHVILLGELLSALLHSASYYFLPKCRLCAGTRTFIWLRGAVYFPGTMIICKDLYAAKIHWYC